MEKLFEEKKLVKIFENYFKIKEKFGSLYSNKKQNTFLWFF